MRNGKSCASCLSWSALLFACSIQSPQAFANLIITLQENGDPMATFPFVGLPTPSTSGAISTATPHYNIQVLSGLEQQTPDQSELLTADVLITKIGTSNDALHLTVTGTDYTGPVAPPTLQVISSISDTCTYAAPRPGNALTFQSTVGSTALGPQNPTIGATGSSADNKTVLLSSLSAPFSIVQSLDFVLTNDGDEFRFGANTVLTPFVPGLPEPAGFGFALAGLALLSRRRRPM